MCVQVVAMLDQTSQPCISAVLTDIKFLSPSLGILLVYMLGAVMEWNAVSGVIAAFPLTSLVVFVLLPERPVWQVKNSETHVAEKLLRWPRGEGPGLQVRGMGQRCEL